MRTKIASRRVVALLGTVGVTAGLLALLAMSREQAWRGTVRDVSEMPWGGDIVASIAPNGDIIAETYYYPDRDHHFARVFGKCNEQSFDRFVSQFAFEPLTGNLWNNRIVEWVPNEERAGFVFSESDIGFVGVVGNQGTRTAIAGAFSRNVGYFVMELKSLD